MQHIFRYSYVKNVDKKYTSTSGAKYIYIEGSRQVPRHMGKRISRDTVHQKKGCRNNDEQRKQHIMIWGTDYDDPMSMISLFTTENSSNIPTNWSNEEFDSLIAQAGKEMDEAKRVDLYSQAEQILFNEGCNICPL